MHVPRRCDIRRHALKLTPAVGTGHSCTIPRGLRTTFDPRGTREYLAASLETSHQGPEGLHDHCRLSFVALRQRRMITEGGAEHTACTLSELGSGVPRTLANAVFSGGAAGAAPHWAHLGASMRAEQPTALLVWTGCVETPKWRPSGRRMCQMSGFRGVSAAHRPARPRACQASPRHCRGHCLSPRRHLRPQPCASCTQRFVSLNVILMRFHLRFEAAH